ncbi:MAG: hypothetical protein R3F61_25625 [Myxococcota bacterium]
MIPLLCALAGAQEAAPVPPPATMLDPGLPTEKRHMAILGTWAGVNLVGGGVGLALARTPEGRTFHGTNLAWNTVNAGLVVIGAVGFPKRTGRPDSVAAVRKRHRGLRTALAINIGFDVVYVGTGVALWAFGGELAGNELAPVGQALAIQGGFLLGFDSLFLASHHRRAGDVSVGPGSVGFSF